MLHSTVRSVALLALMTTVYVAPSSAKTVLENMFADDSLAAPSLRLTNADVDAILADDGDEVSWTDGGDAGTSTRRWWPVLLSAAVPGLGEATTGHMRGYPMIAVDAGIWWFAKSKHDDGHEWEDNFEAFALEHWSESEWFEALAEADQNSMATIIDEYDLGDGSTENDVPLYVSRELDEREWFENLGKWDVFAWGWREYWDPAWNDIHNFDITGNDVYIPNTSDASRNFFTDNATMTPLREEYNGLRKKSDDAFEARDRLFAAAMLLRVVSVLQVSYLEGFIGGRFNDAAAATDAPTVSFFARPRGWETTQLGWKVSF